MSHLIYVYTYLHIYESNSFFLLSVRTLYFQVTINFSLEKRDMYHFGHTYLKIRHVFLYIISNQKDDDLSIILSTKNVVDILVPTQSHKENRNEFRYVYIYIYF